MAGLVGGAFLTAMFEKLFERLASSALRQSSVASKLEELEAKLKRVSLYLDDAEDRQLRDKNVKEWLDELKHFIFMADDLVEQINDSKKDNNPKRKASDFVKYVYHSLAKTVQDEIDLILRELDGLYGRARDLELKYVSSSADPYRRSSPIAPLREERNVYGREAEKEEILKILLSEEDEIIVLPIVGMGGLGKTTLAQLVYDDKRVEEHGFSLKAWVTVSTEFDFCRLMKELLQKFNPEVSSSDPYELQRLMKQALRGKRFLFVLDDVWDENYNNWDLLMSNLRVGGPKGRVIVTTRSRVVASIVMTGPIHELKEVQNDDCWSIFVHHAFNGDMDADPQLQAIGRRIVEKCKGLPLAIRCLGGLLRSERSPQKWERILRSDMGDWSREMENGVLPSLWLSYRYLSSTLKQCFGYSSVFPQDYKFNKKKMVMWWMAEGFIRSNEEGKSMEEAGEEYFDDLVSRSLFQRSSEVEDDDTYVEHDDVTYVVHDMVHDLAAFVYGKFCWTIGDDFKNVTIKTRHLTYNEDISSDFLTSLSTSKHLRTLMNIQSYSFYEKPRLDDFLKEIVLKVRCLRVVSLSTQSSVLHYSLGDLKMLRYLNLYGREIEELPESICSLFHLQTLILSDCYKITRLPMDLPGKLRKLRHLDTLETRLIEMPPKMGSLKELRILTKFVLGKCDGSGCYTLKELGEIHHLGGKLCISKLQNVENVPNAHILRDKAEMKELILRWEDNDWGNMIEKAEDVLHALQPHKNLEKLEVHDYPGSSFPKWVGENSFPKMTYVVLSGGRSSELPPLGQLPSLRKLSISIFQNVEKIGNELLYGKDTNSSVTPFPSLEELKFSSMTSWKEWSFVGRESSCFPRLRSLQIFKCCYLECINREDEDDDESTEMESTKLHHHCPSLHHLTIYECDLLETRYHKDNGDHWHYISHIPDIHIWSNDLYDDLGRELL